MRKYQQLLLLIISLVSFTTLIFYRHEYLKLRSVLSVLNFFGSVDTVNSSCFVFSPDLKESVTQRYKYAEPRSVWSKLGNHYIYSSFWESNTKGGAVRTITVGPKSTFFNYSCRVWFEEGDIIESKKGVLTYDVDFRSRTKTLGETIFKYILRCSLHDESQVRVPYGVLWKVPANSSNVFSPVFQAAKKENSRAVLCVKPDYTGVPKTEIIEFLTYYNSIGINDFIIYDYGIQHSIFPFLESVVGSEEVLQSVAVMTWNFPYSNLLLESISLQDDCLSRTYGSAKVVGITEWNEYIMPSKHNLNDMLTANEHSGLIDISFETWLCCYETLDEKAIQPLPMFLRKTQCTKRENEEKMFINMKFYVNEDKKRIKEVPSDVAILRRYDLCYNVTEESKSVLPVSMFYSQITSHKLLSLWKSHLNTLSIFN